MRNFPIKAIVIHCSATEADQDVTRDTIDNWHKDRGFDMIGYHYVVNRNGSIDIGRQETHQGAHVKGHNRNTLGVCMIGGITDGEPADNFTKVQYVSLGRLIKNLQANHNEADIVGHRDYSPDLNGDGQISKFEWTKHCPCFEVSEFLTTL